MIEIFPGIVFQVNTSESDVSPPRWSFTILINGMGFESNDAFWSCWEAKTAMREFINEFRQKEKEGSALDS